ncbi:NADPH-dependent F420 reductase [Halobellus salinisoli]|uniref:NADPH-dependent F420 reductase n=1 Tax=Halobellus salinisoli TaxID=3108500 RepID=UPI003008E9E8
MRIALLGGTGAVGEGLALRLGRDTGHELVIGSRDPEKARRCAEDYLERLDESGERATIEGGSNPVATEDADLVVLAVPPEYVVDTIDTVREALDEETIVVSPAVKMHRDGDGFHFERTDVGNSITADVAEAVPANVSVVGSFHNLPAKRLAALDTELGIDTAIVADDEAAAETVAAVVASIEGLRAVFAGPISNAVEVESITPLLINLALNNDDMHDVGVRFT